MVLAAHRPECVYESLHQWLGHVVLSQLPGGRDDHAQLVEVVDARVAESQMTFHDEALVAGESALEVVGGKFDEVATG